MIKHDSRKTRLYLDTSVVSAIDAPHKPADELATKKFFQYVKERIEEYELLASPVLRLEIARCPEPKQSMLHEFLGNLDLTRIAENVEVLALADIYVRAGVLNAKHIRDLTHIAYAVVNRCDYIVSWNFEHFVNDKIMTKVNDVNKLNNYANVIIITPTTIIGGNFHDQN
jgi:hypothetical protein